VTYTYVLKTRWQILKVMMAILTGFIILTVAVTIFVLYFVVESITVRVIGSVGLAIVLILLVIIDCNRRFGKAKRKPSLATSVKRLVLMSVDGEREKEWLCEGVSSFLIGKGSAVSATDIDLGDTQYGEYISREHAVMNNLDGIWYIEDLESTNGV